jgi:hypothetical protein
MPEKSAVIQAKWSFDCPFIPAEETWELMIQNAMVDRKRGFISVGDPQPSYTSPPLRRAMNSNRTLKGAKRIRNEEVFTWTIRQYSGWGFDT